MLPAFCQIIPIYINLCLRVELEEGEREDEDRLLYIETQNPNQQINI